AGKVSCRATAASAPGRVATCIASWPRVSDTGCGRQSSRSSGTRSSIWRVASASLSSSASMSSTVSMGGISGACVDEVDRPAGEGPVADEGEGLRLRQVRGPARATAEEKRSDEEVVLVNGAEGLELPERGRAAHDPGVLAGSATAEFREQPGGPFPPRGDPGDGGRDRPGGE